MNRDQLFLAAVVILASTIQCSHEPDGNARISTVSPQWAVNTALSVMAAVDTALTGEAQERKAEDIR